ncbi:CpaF family protein [Kytococcus schroeteri]|uniref:CpaF family protein n=1 Tax=Kytococcus schroeteri TaxID=138300 RepID=UPI0035F077D6
MPHTLQDVAPTPAGPVAEDRPTLRSLEDRVRDVVRRRELDPDTDVQEVRDLVDEVVEAHQQAAGAGRGRLIVDEPAVRRHLVDAVSGLGELQQYLDDPEVEEIWINSPQHVFVARGGRSELTPVLLTDQQVQDLVERMLKSSGRRIDLSSPFVDASLPGGERLHVAIPDITRRHWSVNIRKFVSRAHHLEDLVALGSLTAPAASFLRAAVASGLNVLVSGGTQAGKTTMLNCLAAAIPPHERVVTAEEVFELHVPLRDTVAMQCRQPSLEGTGEITLRRLVKEALRMRPSRIIVGEVRQEEALDLLIGLNSGLPGMATVHANGAREAVLKMCTLPLLAGPNVASSFVVPTVANAVDLVVHCALERDGRRRVQQICALPGRAEGDVIEIADIFTRVEGELVRGDGFPPHTERFARAGFDVREILGAS